MEILQNPEHAIPPYSDEEDVRDAWHFEHRRSVVALTKTNLERQSLSEDGILMAFGLLRIMDSAESALAYQSRCKSRQVA